MGLEGCENWERGHPSPAGLAALVDEPASRASRQAPGHGLPCGDVGGSPDGDVAAVAGDAGDAGDAVPVGLVLALPAGADGSPLGHGEPVGQGLAHGLSDIPALCGAGRGSPPARGRPMRWWPTAPGRVGKGPRRRSRRSRHRRPRLGGSATVRRRRKRQSPARPHQRSLTGAARSRRAAPGWDVGRLRPLGDGARPAPAPSGGRSRTGRRRRPLRRGHRSGRRRVRWVD